MIPAGLPGWIRIRREARPERLRFHQFAQGNDGGRDLRHRATLMSNGVDDESAAPGQTITDDKKNYRQRQLSCEINRLKAADDKTIKTAFPGRAELKDLTQMNKEQKPCLEKSAP